jgi:hypothetical protein
MLAVPAAVLMPDQVRASQQAERAAALVESDGGLADARGAETAEMITAAACVPVLAINPGSSASSAGRPTNASTSAGS